MTKVLLNTLVDVTYGGGVSTPACGIPAKRFDGLEGLSGFVYLDHTKKKGSCFVVACDKTKMTYHVTITHGNVSQTVRIDSRFDARTTHAIFQTAELNELTLEVERA